MKVDINCDMGESFGLYSIGNDEEMLQYATTANIGCGFHAGDPHVMRQTIELAKVHGVGIGAHPGFPDLMGFGRRRILCTPKEIEDYIVYQLGALQGFATAAGMVLQHCKPHGALYMMAMEDEKIAQAVIEGVAKINSDLILLGTNNSAMAYVASKMGIRIALEVYADREHNTDGSIVLTRTGPQIADASRMAKRVARMVKEGKVTAYNGEDTDVVAHTVCVHGDNPDAPKLIKAIREELIKEGIQVVPLREIV